MNKTQTFSKKAHELRQKVIESIDFCRTPYDVVLFKHDIPDATERIHIYHRTSEHISGAVITSILEVVSHGYVDVINGKATMVISID